MVDGDDEPLDFLFLLLLANYKMWASYATYSAMWRLIHSFINASESRERVNNYNLSQISKRLAKAFLVLDQERCLFVFKKKAQSTKNAESFSEYWLWEYFTLNWRWKKQEIKCTNKASWWCLIKKKCHVWRGGGDTVMLGSPTSCLSKGWLLLLPTKPLCLSAIYFFPPRLQNCA